MKPEEGVCVKPLFEDLSKELIDRDIRPSYQRLKILE
jgi:hypothetical protein